MTLKEHSSVQLPVSKIEKDANYFCYFFLSSFLPGCRYEANDFGSGTNENFGSNRIRINNTSKESLFGSYVCENFILLFIKSRSQQSGSLTMQLRVVPHYHTCDVTLFQVLSVVDPPVREAGQTVVDVDELCGKLKEKGFHS